MGINATTAREFSDLAAELQLIGLTLPDLPVTGTETLRIQTDNTWEVSADGRTWVAATKHSAFGRNPGIWDASSNADVAETLLFRKTFAVPGAILAARAEGGADDDLLSFAINGTKLFGESSGFADTLLIDNAIDLAIFGAGMNLITATARDVHASHSAFGATLTIEFVPIPLLAATLGGVRSSGGIMVEDGSGAALFHGTGRADLLAGGAGMDEISGWRGNDVILGGSGSDRLNGDGGDDMMFGGEGDDVLIDTVDGWYFGREDGRDTLIGGGGNDRLYGGDGDDMLSGGAGNDFLNGRRGDDLLAGGAGTDQLWSGIGNDRLLGGDGRDQLGGGVGADTLEGGAGNDTVNGGAGDDAIRLGAGDDLAMHYRDDYSFDFGRGNDLIWGEDGADRMHGGRGDDRIDGGAGDDILNGGAGTDLLTGGAGSDLFEFRGAYGVDTITDFATDDRLGVGRGINGLAEMTAESLLVRMTDAAEGARLDLGNGNAVIFEGLAATAVAGMLATALEFI